MREREQMRKRDGERERECETSCQWQCDRAKEFDDARDRERETDMHIHRVKINKQTDRWIVNASNDQVEIVCNAAGLQL